MSFEKTIQFPDLKTYADFFGPRRETKLFSAENKISDYCALRGETITAGFYASPKEFVTDYINREMLTVVDGTIFFEFVVRSDGTALLCAQWNEIIGSRWLGVIDAGTIPTTDVGLSELDMRLARNRVGQVLREIVSECTVEGCNLILPPTRLEKDSFGQLKLMIENLGGRWKGGKVQAFAFPEDPSDKIDQIITTGFYTKLDRVGFFPTGRELVMRVIDLAEIQPGNRVLEPSAGDGRMADEVRRRFPFIDIDVVELQPKLRDGLLGKGHHLLPEPDFMKVESNILYDRIVMNPPFEFQQDIDHVLHAYDLLAPGGRLVSIMAEAVTWRRNRKAAEFRAFLGALPKLPSLQGHVEVNPKGSFKEAGVNVNTVTVVIVKE